MSTDLMWRKSSYSGGESGNCVEVADGISDIVPVRDSKDPHGPALGFSHEAWRAFTSSMVRSRMPGWSGTANPRAASSGRTRRIAADSVTPPPAEAGGFSLTLAGVATDKPCP
ncbi:DUF397 domain-containing protein [Kitasatospora sp. NPDC059408]|uniref:DUF397 domain-containing protein n=1 Tax=Kitasatospora sp. NPDC059408 TaxID=3346823 RepID=UPI0036AF1BCF